VLSNQIIYITFPDFGMEVFIILDTFAIGKNRSWKKL